MIWSVAIQFVAWGVSASPAVPAAAPASTIEFDAIDLAMGTLGSTTAHESGELTFENRCKAQVFGNGSHVEGLKLKACEKTFPDMERDSTVSSTIAGQPVKIVLRPKKSSTLKLEDPRVERKEQGNNTAVTIGSPNIHAGAFVAVFALDRWMPLAVAEGKAEGPIPGERGTWVKNPSLQALNVAMRAKGSKEPATIIPVPLEGGTVAREVTKPKDATPPSNEDDKPLSCALAESSEHVRVLPFEYDGAGLSIAIPEDGLVLPPQTTIMVRISANDAASLAGLTAELDGTAALAALELAGGQRSAGATHGVSVTSTQSATKYVKCFPFAPREPGARTLKINKTQTATSAQNVGSVELIVEKRYSGALRAGVAAIFGAVDRKYRVETLPGSDQAQIGLEANRLNFDVELVVGYSLYMEALFWGGGGRSHNGYKSKIIAPYFGMGVVASKSGTEATVSLLRSFYVGADVELHPNFSVTLAAALRIVDRLPEGLALGSAIEATTREVPTVREPTFGFAVLVNLSPEMFKTALGTKLE